MTIFLKRHKYGAKRTVCGNGHTHPSKAEARYCDALHASMKFGGDIVEIKTQVKFDFIVNGKRIGHHTVDFLVKTRAGLIEVREVKGFRVRDFSLRQKLFEALYPHIKYVVVK